MPAEMPAVPVTTSTFVEANVVALQPVIGRYPPRFASEEHRDQVYARWSRALIAARNLDTRVVPLECKMSLLSELYRQGYNLDVRGAGPQALTTIERCLELFPRSRWCNRSASFFYVTTTGIPDRFARAERSLTVLRELAAPAPDEDAEAGFVWLALYRGDRGETNRLIDRYLRTFPNSPYAEEFRALRRARTVEIKEWKSP